MEDITTSFFINGLKLHIESSLNRYKDNPNLIFEENFENIFLNPIFINNINLFREIIEQNNLNFKIFWNHIGKIMNKSINYLMNIFQNEIKIKKENLNKEENNEENNIIELSEINYIKLNILNICLYFITSEESDSFDSIKGDNKDKLKKLLEIYIKKEIKNSHDFTIFIKNYIIKLTLLINNNGMNINLEFLKYLLVEFYNFESIFNKNEQVKNLEIYINQVINNPRYSLNNYINGTSNKKINKKERICRSRGASFDIKDTYNNTEKNNKKISDYFKKESNSSKENLNNKNTIKNKGTNNLLNYIKEENNKLKDIKNNQGKILHFFNNPSNMSLFNIGSSISNHSNSFFLSEGFSFSKNNNYNNSKLGLDDSISMSKLFSKPISELNENKENKENKDNKKMFLGFPCLIKRIQNKKRKPLERLRNKLFNSQMNIKKFMKIENKNENIEKVKELRNMVNLNFYGNNNIKDIKNKNKENENIENIKDIENNNENNDKNILISKTPIKNENINNENNENNIKENFNLIQLKKNWEILFSQKTGL